MMKKIFLIAGVLVFGGVFLTGCQQNTNTAQNSSTVSNQGSSTQVASNTSNGKVYDPCLLLTEQDVKDVFPDGTISQTQHDTEANAVGQKICYYSASDTDVKYVQLSVVSTAALSAESISNGQSAEALYNNTKSYLTGTTPVTGLGDDAYFGGSSLTLGRGLSVLVKNKQAYFSIDVGLGFGNSDDQKHLDIEKSIAQKIIGRL